MNIVIPDHIDLDENSRNDLELLPHIKIYDDTINDPKVIIERINNAEVVTANFIDLTEEIINACPKLKYIVSPAVGFDWIDSKTATEKGIKILNCPTFNSQAVAEHAIALMLAVERNLFVLQNIILNGKYMEGKKIIGHEISEKLLVTIGHGNIGKKITDMATGLGMEVAWADSKNNNAQIDQLVSQADVLVLTLPLNERTKGILNAKRIDSMKKTAIVINVARGLVIDQLAFYEALKEGKIAGAGIDTFAKDENLSEMREDILNFAKLPNVIATPHVAFKTEEATGRLGQELIFDIESCLNNSPVNVVN